jgi:hypothetical protein
MIDDFGLLHLLFLILHFGCSVLSCCIIRLPLIWRWRRGFRHSALELLPDSCLMAGCIVAISASSDLCFNGPLGFSEFIFSSSDSGLMCSDRMDCCHTWTWWTTFSTVHIYSCCGLTDWMDCCPRGPDWLLMSTNRSCCYAKQYWVTQCCAMLTANAVLYNTALCNAYCTILCCVMRTYNVVLCNVCYAMLCCAMITVQCCAVQLSAMLCNALQCNMHAIVFYYMTCML